MNPGSAAWLVEQEERFGGYADRIERRQVSPYDPRTPEQIAKGGMVGGDRMSVHNYAPIYSRHLKRFLRKDDLTIVECGVLQGVGLAIWAELFPNARIIGLDIDLSHYQENLHRLKELGAFKNGEPEVYRFDQFAPAKYKVPVKKIDIFIDDGYHSKATIVQTWRHFSDRLADEFAYFIEDNSKIWKFFRASEIYALRYGDMTVIRDKP